MSLLNDLNPEVRQLLDADKKQYPNTVKAIINDLQNAVLVGDIPVSTATNLLDYANKVVKFDTDNFVLKLYKIFGK